MSSEIFATPGPEKIHKCFEYKYPLMMQIVLLDIPPFHSCIHLSSAYIVHEKKIGQLFIKVEKFSRLLIITIKPGEINSSIT